MVTLKTQKTALQFFFWGVLDGENREARRCAKATKARDRGNCRRQYNPSNTAKPSTHADVFLALCASTATENMNPPTCAVKKRKGGESAMVVLRSRLRVQKGRMAGAAGKVLFSNISVGKSSAV